VASASQGHGITESGRSTPGLRRPLSLEAPSGLLSEVRRRAAVVGEPEGRGRAHVAAARVVSGDHALRASCFSRPTGDDPWRARAMHANVKRRGGAGLVGPDGSSFQTQPARIAVSAGESWNNGPCAIGPQPGARRRTSKSPIGAKMRAGLQESARFAFGRADAVEQCSEARRVSSRRVVGATQRRHPVEVELPPVDLASPASSARRASRSGEPYRLPTRGRDLRSVGGTRVGSTRHRSAKLAGDVARRPASPFNPAAHPTSSVGRTKQTSVTTSEGGEPSSSSTRVTSVDVDSRRR